MKTWTGALCVALGASLASTAAAQPTDRRAEARARANEGLALHKHGDDAGALLKFQQAYALVPLPELLFDLALAEQRTGHLLDAQAAFRKCAADPAFAAHVADAKQHLDELKGLLGHLKIDAPAQSSVTVDGQPVADWSVDVDVMPGTHVLMATNGWQVTHSVDAPPGQETPVSLNPPPGTVTPPPPVAAPAASTATPPPPATTPVDTPPPDSSSSSTSPAKYVVAGTLAGLAVVSVGVGVVFGVQSISKSNDIKTLNGQAGSAQCPAAGPTVCQGLSSDYNSQKTDSTAAGVLYVTGGVLAAGAVLTWLLWPSATTSGAWITPSVGPQWAGVAGGGSF